MGFAFFDFFAAAKQPDELFSLAKFVRPYGRNVEQAATDARQVIAQKIEQVHLGGKTLTVDVGGCRNFNPTLFGKVFENLQEETGLTTAEILDHLDITTSGHSPSIYPRMIKKFILENDGTNTRGPSSPKP